MARRTRRSKRKSQKRLTNQAKPVQRDNFLSQSGRLLGRSKNHKPFNYELKTIEDRRTESARRRPPRPKTLDSRPAKIETYQKRVAKKKTPLQHEGLRFRNPEQTVVCWKRKIRRAVLFATRNTGKGSSQKFRKYNENSKISCRR